MKPKDTPQQPNPEETKEESAQSKKTDASKDKLLEKNPKSKDIKKQKKEKKKKQKKSGSDSDSD